LVDSGGAEAEAVDEAVVEGELGGLEELGVWGRLRYRDELMNFIRGSSRKLLTPQT